MAKNKPKPKPTYTASLRPELAELVAKALEQSRLSSSAFTATALAFYSLKQLEGRWPKKLPEDLQPRKAGRRWPKADE